MSNTGTKYGVTTWLMIKPWIVASATFLVISSLSLLVIMQRYYSLQAEEKQAATDLALSAKSRLQQALQYSLSATQALTLTIDKDGIPRNFDSIAAYIFDSHRNIDALQLVPGGVIKYVYPLEENKSVLGYNIFADSTRNREALKAVEKKELFFAGPLQLRQGGIGVVGRLPVFRKNQFWGFSAVIIKLETLLRAAGIDTAKNNGYHFQLSKINPTTSEEEKFLPEEKGSYARHEVSVEVPDGEWKLTVQSTTPFKTIIDILPISAFAIMLAVIAGLFAAYLTKTPDRLRKLVMQKTAQLDKSEKRNKAIVNALPDMVFILNRDGRFVDYNNPSGHKTLMPKDEFIGKKIGEVMPPGLAGELSGVLEKTFTERRMLTYSYHIQMEDELHYYEARFIPQDTDDALVLVRDVTDAKLSEQRIRESEVKYRTLVEQATDGIFIADFKGYLQVVNPAGCALSQYSEAELLTMRVHDLTVLNDLNAMPFKFDEILAGKTATSERKLKRKDGKLIDVEISARIIAPDRFLAFVRDIGERKKAESELRKSREDLRRLSNYIENIREEERLNLSREIHEELGQQLTVLKIDISRLSRKASDPGLSTDFEQVIFSVNHMVDTVRRISADLRPGMLDDLGLAATLEWYCNDFSRRSGLKCNFSSSLAEEEIPREINVCLFRIYQESMTNIVKHADADSVNVTLSRQDDQLVMHIEDDGKGLDPSELSDKKTLGLMGMRERAMLVGGTYTIHSTPSKGTLIEVVIPLKK